MQFNNASADAFGPVSLSRFAAAPNSAHLFRAQHEHLVRLMDAISTDAHALETGRAEDRPARALEISLSMITLKSFLATNHKLQSGMMHKILGSDPRHRMLAEQHERDALVALGALDKLVMSYGAPSRILDGFSTFSDDSLPVFTTIKDRFRIEERDLFAVFDRMVASTVTTPAQIPEAPDSPGSSGASGAHEVPQPAPGNPLVVPLENSDADVINAGAFFEAHRDSAGERQEAAAVN